MNNSPEWNPENKLESIKDWCRYLHEKAWNMFNQDGTHASMLFLFDDNNGLVSVNLVPPEIDHDAINTSIKDIIKEHHLYGVIYIGETWTYSYQGNDHTAFQILDGEMRVSDLRDEDKEESLIVCMECREGKRVIYQIEIIKSSEKPEAGVSQKCTNESLEWFTSSV